MALIPGAPTSPFVHNEAIVDKDGRPTAYFLRQLQSQSIINTGSGDVIEAINSLAIRVTALENRLLTAGNGLDGGGDLTADRTFSLTDPAYDIAMYFPDDPTNAQTMAQLTFAHEVNFPDDFAGSTGLVGTNPTAAATMDIKRDSVSIGTISITTGGIVTFSTSGGATEVFNIGDKLEIINQATADATLADVSISLKGTRIFL